MRYLRFYQMYRDRGYSRSAALHFTWLQFCHA
jgi:hypothetical protein